MISIFFFIFYSIIELFEKKNFYFDKIWDWKELLISDFNYFQVQFLHVKLAVNPLPSQCQLFYFFLSRRIMSKKTFFPLELQTLSRTKRMQALQNLILNFPTRVFNFLTWNILLTLSLITSSSSIGSLVLPTRSNTDPTTSSISSLNIILLVKEQNEKKYT